MLAETELNQQFFNPLNAKVIGLRGYINNNDYSKAKHAIQTGYTDPEFQGLTLRETDEHLKSGGWVGFLVPEGCIVVDIDNKEQGELVLTILQQLNISFHAIETVRGYQFILKDTGEIKAQQNGVVSLLGVKVDYRLANKGYIVAPSYNTEKRTWVHIDDELSPMPFFFNNIGQPRRDQFYIDLPIGEGSRNDNLYRWGCKLIELGIDKKQIFNVLIALGQHACTLSLSYKEIQTIHDSVSKREPSKKRELYLVNAGQVTGDDTIENIKAQLEVSPMTGKLITNARNLEKIFNSPIFKGVIGYDVFRQREVIFSDLPWREKHHSHSKYEQWLPSDDHQLVHWINKHFDMKGKETITSAYINATRDSQFHPVKEFIESGTWDGEMRVETFFIDYLGAEDNKYTRSVTKKWFTAAVKRIYEPGCKFDSMPVLYGDQGLGKSFTVGKLGGEWFSDSLRNFDSKEAGEHLQSGWIFEIGELAAMKKSEEEIIKSFLSKQVDSFRAAYARTVTDNPRHCVFIGTTNTHDFLKDTTGNRRFLPISVSKNRKYDPFKDFTEEVVLQMWAEALVLYRNGEPIHLDAEIEAMAKQIQEEHTEMDPLTGKVAEYLERLLPVDWDTYPVDSRAVYMNDDTGYKIFISKNDTVQRSEVSPVEIWCECYGREQNDMTSFDGRKISGILRSLGWEQTSRKNVKPYGKQSVFVKK